MMDMIAGAFGTLKTASDITQGLLALKTDAAVSAKAVELNRIIFEVQQQLFAAQTDYAAITSRVRDLESQIAQFKNWEHEKQRYELHELAPGTLVYRLKESEQGSEPIHHICPNCYEQGFRSLIQASKSPSFHEHFTCPKCNANFIGKPVKMGGFVEISSPRGF